MESPPADFKSAASAVSPPPRGVSRSILLNHYLKSSSQTSSTRNWQPINRVASIQEATAGLEPAIKVLQTSALPLGYVAILETLRGAEDEIRTRDPLLGKEMLYH